MLSLLLVATLALAPDSLVVTPAWLDAHRADTNLVIFHLAMDRADYDRGHVPGARWVNPHDFFVSGPPGVELPSAERMAHLLDSLGVTEQSRIVYYGDTWMSPRVFLALDYVGLGDHAAWLDGGLPAWVQAQRPLSREPVSWTPTHNSLTAHPEILADTTWLRENLAGSRLLLLDGRSPGEYDGSDHSEGLPRSGHIPGAVNLPWEKTFTNGPAALEGTASALQAPEALRGLFAEAGVTSARDLVIYCTVGLRASHLYFIARRLGWHPRIYDGSMSQWSRVAGLPVITGSSPR